MSLQGLLMRRVSGVLLCCGVWMPFQAVMAQQAISNPLVRPAGLGAGGASGAAAAQKTEAQNAAAQPPASPDLRDKAASRLSQEDFNLKQQALNASAIPAPLGSLFNQMMVSAVVGGSVVLRRADVLAAQGQQQATQAGTTGTGGQTNGGGGGRGATGLGVAGGAMVTSSVLRLKVGQATNLNGYVLRARVEGMDVFVDWKNEMGAWVGVFFGALESAGTVAVTPAKDTLEKVDTSSFDYLKPQVSNRVSGNSTTGTNGQNGSSNNSGLGNTGSSNTGSAASF